MRRARGADELFIFLRTFFKPNKGGRPGTKTHTSTPPRHLLSHTYHLHAHSTHNKHMTHTRYTQYTQHRTTHTHNTAKFDGKPTIPVVTFGPSAPVMYDAMGVRRQAGYHATAINNLVTAFPSNGDLSRAGGGGGGGGRRGNARGGGGGVGGGGAGVEEGLVGAGGYHSGGASDEVGAAQVECRSPIRSLKAPGFNPRAYEVKNWGFRMCFQTRLCTATTWMRCWQEEEGAGPGMLIGTGACSRGSRRGWHFPPRYVCCFTTKNVRYQA
jgi:hypothetical protein